MTSFFHNVFRGKGTLRLLTNVKVLIIKSQEQIQSNQIAEEGIS